MASTPKRDRHFFDYLPCPTDDCSPPKPGWWRFDSSRVEYIFFMVRTAMDYHFDCLSITETPSIALNFDHLQTLQDRVVQVAERPYCDPLPL